MLNKEKVNEIVADMQEEERKEKLRQEGIADKFLENRLEYYVAMVVNKKINNFSSLIDTIDDDNVPHSVTGVVLNKIEDSLEELDIFRLMYSYKHIGDIEKFERFHLDPEIAKRIKDRKKELGIEIVEKDKTRFSVRDSIKKIHEDNELKEQVETYKLISDFLLVFLILALVFIFLLCTH